MSHPQKKRVKLAYAKYGKAGVSNLRIYLDSAPVIYLVEEHTPYDEYVEERLSDPANTLLASELTRLECRVKPVREFNRILLHQFDRFFGRTVNEMVELTREVMDRATFIRARYGFAAPDAIHLGAALASRCDVFLTNDSRLSRFGEMSVEVLGDELQE